MEKDINFTFEDVYINMDNKNDKPTKKLLNDSSCNKNIDDSFCCNKILNCLFGCCFLLCK